MLSLSNHSSAPIPGYTPCLLTTFSDGQQRLQQIGSPLPPIDIPSHSPIPMLPMLDSAGNPVFMSSASPSLPFNFFPTSPSCSPLPLVSSPLPTSFPQQAAPLIPWNMVEPQCTTDLTNDAFKIHLNDDGTLKVVDDEDSGDLTSQDISHSRSRSLLRSMSQASVYSSTSDFPEIERPMEPKLPVENSRNIPLPKLEASMTKKDLVNSTLDYLYEVFGQNFDTEGNRGENVLRIKVKTRGSLEHICTLVEKCVSEKLVCQISCPISTKKARSHIRGYLAYIEAVSSEAADRVTEIFEQYNKSVLVKDANSGTMDHPFKGISRNPIAIREKKQKH